ncbi:MAG: hypothetical protein FWD79_10415, partial [Desulfobulbus sp.]|nr:hypothetical protein [Desulfobulbus sp.]
LAVYAFGCRLQHGLDAKPGHCRLWIGIKLSPREDLFPWRAEKSGGNAKKGDEHHVKDQKTGQNKRTV